jgi:putative ABC transport system permease protein
MSLWSRIVNVLRSDRLSREIDEELEAHVEEAIAQGRNPVEARRALGPALRLRDESREIRALAWLDALRADALFGWRQVAKHKVTSAAAILSIGLALGACLSAFRLIDALLWRPLPIAGPDRLYVLSRHTHGPDGMPRSYDGFEYPLFRSLRAAARGQAELLAISYAERRELTLGPDQDMEKAHVQFVSGWTFGAFGLHPALGRLLTEQDDVTPGGHPYAVLSHDYWTRRFGRDPRAIGRTFRMENTLYEIVGVAEAGFTGTEPGTVTGIFVPTMMHDWVTRSDATWSRTLVMLKPGAALESLPDRLRPPFRAFLEERARGFVDLPKAHIDRFLGERLVLDPAPAGVSGMQESYRQALWVLASLVALVLLIACANVANLMSAQASARAREMAVRVSIGAGRWRLVQLVLVESTWLACLAAVVGAAFAWWSAPFVVGLINPPDNPARFLLPLDWRVVWFGVSVTLGATSVFGLAPALFASSATPMSVLRSGHDPRARRRVMHTLIALQVAFCFFVLFVAGLLVATLERLSHRPTGFSAERLLAVEAMATPAQPPALWEQVTERIRALPGVEMVALAGWPLLGGGAWSGVISVNGAPPTDVQVLFLPVSPGFTQTMSIPFVGGRDFRGGDAYPGAMIVNEAFARQYFNSENPVGRFVERTDWRRMRLNIVGLVRDVRYRRLREPAVPVAFVPFQSKDGQGRWQPTRRGTFMVRTSSADPLALAPLVREEVARARPEFSVSNIRTQSEVNRAHTVRERLLATLASFFAIVALALASVGLYGVLHYSVLQQRRDIAIRMALGARPGHVARGVTAGVSSMVIAGALAGVVAGILSARLIATLFYEVRATDPVMLALPSLALLTVMVLAAWPPVMRAIRLDPIKTLRAD